MVLREILEGASEARCWQGNPRSNAGSELALVRLLQRIITFVKQSRLSKAKPSQNPLMPRIAADLKLVALGRYLLPPSACRVGAFVDAEWLSFCDMPRNDSHHCLENTLDTLGRSHR